MKLKPKLIALLIVCLLPLSTFAQVQDLAPLIQRELDISATQLYAAYQPIAQDKKLEVARLNVARSKMYFRIALQKEAVPNRKLVLVAAKEHASVAYYLVNSLVPKKKVVVQVKRKLTLASASQLLAQSDMAASAC